MRILFSLLAISAVFLPGLVQAQATTNSADDFRVDGYSLTDFPGMFADPLGVWCTVPKQWSYEQIGWSQVEERLSVVYRGGRSCVLSPDNDAKCCEQLGYTYVSPSVAIVITYTYAALIVAIVLFIVWLIKRFVKRKK